MDPDNLAPAVPTSTPAKNVSFPVPPPPDKSRSVLAIFAVVGAILLSASYFLFSSLKTQLTSSEAGSDQTNQDLTSVEEILGYDPQNGSTIILGETFEPEFLQIKVGQNVTWVNQSEKRATIDSSPHPGHNDHPSLNLGEFDNGDTLTLVFTEPGIYKYHNHFDGTQFGTIIVEE